MGLWSRKKLLRNKDELIKHYKEEIQTYQQDLKQQNKLLSQFMEKELEHQKKLDEKTEIIQQIEQKMQKYEQKLIEFEQREIEYKRQLNQMAMNTTKPRKHETPVSEGHYKTMAKIAQKLSSEQRSSISPRKTQRVFPITSQGSRNYPRSQTSNQSVQFNPFQKRQVRSSFHYT